MLKGVNTQLDGSTLKKLATNKVHVNQQGMLFILLSYLKYTPVDNSEVKSKLRYHEVTSEKHSLVQREYQSQSSVPSCNKPPFPFNRSKSNPRRSGRRHNCDHYLKQPNNCSWQVFDKYYDKIVEILSHDQVLCSKVLEDFHAKFLINISEKYVIDQLTCPDIKTRAIMDAVGTFISKHTKFKICLLKLVDIFSNFQETKMISDKLKEEG